MDLLAKRLADREMTIEFSDAVLEKILEAGFDPVYGARPLKRAIQNKIENSLANEVLSGTIKDGDHIKVELDERNTISFNT